MKNLKKRSLAMLLTFCMVLTMVPTVALADGETETESIALTTNYGQTDAASFVGSDSITITGGADSVTIAVSATHNHKADTISIEIPMGMKLTTAPGVSAVTTSGAITSKSYSESETAYFGATTPTWVANTIESTTTQSGTLTYELDGIAESVNFNIIMVPDPIYVDAGEDAGNYVLGDFTASMTGTQIETMSDSMTLSITTLASSLHFDSLSFTEVVPAGLSSVASEKDIMYNSSDSVLLSARYSKNLTMSGATYTMRAESGSFTLTVPDGAEVTAYRPTVFSVTQIGVTNQYTIKVLTGSNLTANGNSSYADLDNFAMVDFSDCTDYVADESLAVYVSDLEINIKKHDTSVTENNVFELKTYHATTGVNTTANVPVLASPDVNNYAPTFNGSTGDTEIQKPTVQIDQTLYSVSRKQSTAGTSPTLNTWSPIKIEFVASVDTSGNYLDNISGVVMNVPLLGLATDPKRYSSQLTKISIKYEENGVVDTAYTEYTTFSSAYAPDLTQSSQAISVIDDIAVYTWSNSGQSPQITFTPPSGKNIVSIIVECAGDNATFLSGNSFQVLGVPKSDTQTDDYSNYHFILYGGTNTGALATSYTRGFRWAAVTDFELEVEPDTTVTTNYMYNTAKGNTILMSGDVDYSSTRNTLGYHNLGSATLSNGSGSATDTNITIRIDADITYDVVKEIYFPLNPEGEDNQVLSLSYKYVGSDTVYTYNQSTAQSHYTKSTDDPYAAYVVGVAGAIFGIVTASGDDALEYVEVVLDGWGSSATTKSYAMLRGYIASSEDITRVSNHTITVNSSTSISLVQMFKEPTVIGAGVAILDAVDMEIKSGIYQSQNLDCNVVTPGISTTLQFDIMGGGSLGYPYDGSWHDITFNMILPYGVEVSSATTSDIWYQWNGSTTNFSGATTTETGGEVSVEATGTLTADEADAYFGITSGTVTAGATGATIYTCTLKSDVNLYQMRHSSANGGATITVSLKLDATTDADAVTIPWDKVLVMGSNSDAYTSFSNLTMGGYGEGATLSSIADIYNPGETTSVVVGPSDKYITIYQSPILAVHDAYLTDNEGNVYVYDENDAEDTTPIFSCNDKVTMHFSITDMVEDTVQVGASNYVLFALPTSTSASALTDAVEFASTITGAATIGNTTGATVSVKYVNLPTDTLTYSSISALFSGNSATETVQTDSNAIILQITNQPKNTTITVSLPFQMPNTILDGVKYATLKGASSYYFEAGNTQKYDCTSAISFAYYYPGHTITYSVNYVGGGTTISDTYAWDAEFSFPDTKPTLAGYEFAGWSTNVVGDVIDTSEVTYYSDLSFAKISTYAHTLYAQWTEKSYDITLNANGGTVAYDSVSTTWTGVVPTLPTPTRTGCTFEGWYVGGVKVEAGDSFSSTFGDIDNPTLTAKWTEGTYTLTLVYQDDTTVNSSTQYLYSAAIALADQTRTGYTFKGWYTAASGGTKIENEASFSSIGVTAKDRTLYAQWTENSYTITLNYAEGTNTVASPTTTTLTLKWSDTFTLPSIDPDNSAYHFANWQYGGDALPTAGTFSDTIGALLSEDSTNITLYAHYAQNIITVNYYIPFNGDTFLTEPTTLWQTITMGADDEITQTYPAKDGYTFNGWHTKSTYNTSISDEYTAQEVFTNHAHGAVNDIYAEYEANEYKVIYDKNAGSSEPYETQESIKWVDTIVFPTAPTRDGYTFTGWYRTNTDGTLTNQITAGKFYSATFGETMTETQTVYAGWQKNTYNVKYDLNGATGTIPATQSLTCDGTITAVTGLTRTGYSFVGWNIASDATTAGSYTNYASTGGTDENGASVTLYAIWSANSYTVTYDANDNSNGTSLTDPTSQTMPWDETFTGVYYPTFGTVTGYTFSGWYTYGTDGTDGTEVTAQMTYGEVAGTEGNITLYAHWTAGAYTVSYNEGGIASVSMGYNDLFTLTTTVPTMDGYTFAGWYYNDTKVESGVFGTLFGNNTSVTLSAHWTEHTPTATVDYANEVLTGLVAGASYTITVDGTAYPLTADSNGKIALADTAYDWFGSEISIVKVSDSSSTTYDSLAQTITLVARPVVPYSSLAENTAATAYVGAELFTLDCDDARTVTIHYTIYEHDGQDLIDDGDYNDALSYAIKETSDLEIYAKIPEGQEGAGLKSETVEYVYYITENMTVVQVDESVTADTLLISSVFVTGNDALDAIYEELMDLSTTATFGLIRIEDEDPDDNDVVTEEERSYLVDEIPSGYSEASAFHIHATVNDIIIEAEVQLSTPLTVVIQLDDMPSNKTYQVLHMKHGADGSEDVEIFSTTATDPTYLLTADYTAKTLSMSVDSLSPFMVVSKSTSSGSTGGYYIPSTTTTTTTTTSTDDEDTATVTLNSDDHFAYMNGYLDGSFGMDKSITRAETIVMFSRLMTETMDMDATYSCSFTDVTADLWYANYVGFMEEYGILTGYLDGTFRGDEPISRAEFATVASRFDELIASETGSAFYDVADTHWAIDYINSAAEHGWVNGYLDGSFRPDQSITRAEAVTVVNHMLGRSCDTDFVTTYADEITSFIDLTTAHWAYWDIMEATNAHDYTKDDDGNETWSALK